MSGTRRLQRALTRTELRVFPLLMRLLTNKEIAAALGVSERTAKFHVSSILAKARRLGGHAAGCGRVALYKHFALPRRASEGSHGCPHLD